MANRRNIHTMRNIPARRCSFNNNSTSYFSTKANGMMLTLFLLCVFNISPAGCTTHANFHRGSIDNRAVVKNALGTFQEKGKLPHDLELLQLLSTLTGTQQWRTAGTDEASGRQRGDGLKLQRVKRAGLCPQGEDQHRTQAVSYVSEYFQSYGNKDKLSLEDFDAILAHIGLKRMTRFANDSSRDHSHEDHEQRRPDSLGGDDGRSHNDTDNHHGHDHKRRRREVDNTQADRGHNHNGTGCLTSSQILADYGITSNLGISPSDFLNLCPSLIYQLDSGACAEKKNGDGGHPNEEEESERISDLVWLYSMLSVFIISLCALFGILCIPRRGGNENLIMQFLIALAMGSMSGDGMLHLIPHAIIPHHEHDEESGHEEDDGPNALDGMYKGLVALIGVYSFFFMERSFAIMRTRKNKRITEAGSPMVPISGLNDDHSTPVDSHGHSHEGMFSCTSLAMVIIVGDMFHNFCDGLAIGAAFAGSLSVGISTSIAVFCHELPHEIGDFAVLITSGMSSKRAISFNLLSTVPCFVGAAIGLELGSLGDVSLWIFAFVGGLFMYISLVDLVPEMTRPYASANNPWKLYLLLHTCGISLGVSIMVILGIYEEDLQQILT